MKTECLDATCVWLSARTVARKVSCYADWFNLNRPHQGLRGRTPHEVSAKTRRPQPLTIGKRDVVKVSRHDLHDDPKLPVYTIRVRKSA